MFNTRKRKRERGRGRGRESETITSTKHLNPYRNEDAVKKARKLKTRANGLSKQSLAEIRPFEQGSNRQITKDQQRIIKLGDPKLQSPGKMTIFYRSNRLQARFN